jgi:hypothetical protein
MLYGSRAELARVVVTRTDAAGRAAEAFAEVVLHESRGGDWSKPFVFPAINKPLEAGRLYTLDPCPNEWYSYWCAQVVEGLCDGSPNALYDRLVSPPAAGDGAGSPGQVAFLAGLDAFRAAGLLHDFEPGKRVFIGGHARTPVLLVQGPPGTGKSYSTAFAVFARLQGAMADGRPCRAFLSCKTHAATDELLKNALTVRTLLGELRAADPALFARHFDPRLLGVPVYRVVVPHRAQRAAPQAAYPELSVIDPATGRSGRSAVDTVERFQGGERTVVLVSATESDRAYLLASAGFLLDPRRLTVAVSRAKRKMVLVAARSVFALFSPDEETFENAQLWKNLLGRTCTTRLWAGQRDGRRVEVWGGREDRPAAAEARGA